MLNPVLIHATLFTKSDQCTRILKITVKYGIHINNYTAKIKLYPVFIRDSPS